MGTDEGGVGVGEGSGGLANGALHASHVGDEGTVANDGSEFGKNGLDVSDRRTDDDKITFASGFWDSPKGFVAPILRYKRPLPEIRAPGLTTLRSAGQLPSPSPSQQTLQGHQKHNYLYK